MRIAPLCAAFVLSLASAATAGTLTTYNSQAAFEAALDKSFTLIDLALWGETYEAASAGDARFLARGLDIINADPRGFTSFLVNGTNYPATQTPTVAMFNGSGTASTADDFAVNFVNPVNGFGFAPNRIDRGQVILYGGADLTGPILGVINNDGSGNFVGGITDMTIRSAQITCDFDGDYTCGLTDFQFGTTTAATVPLPAGLPMLVGALGLLGLWRRIA